MSPLISGIHQVLHFLTIGIEVYSYLEHVFVPCCNILLKSNPSFQIYGTINGFKHMC